MSEVYWACFERGDDGLARLEGEERVSKPAEVKLPPSWATAIPAGRGFLAYSGALGIAVPSVTAATPSGHAPDPTQLLPRATEIALLAVPAVAAGRLLPPEAATPVYLRDNVTHVAATPKVSK
jgi:tRNA threonylcarbamoyladenosine biosynthesis protein TsaB